MTPETASLERRVVELPPFWALVEAHGDELLRHARRLAGDDAEDVLQEAFLRAIRSYPRLEHGAHLRAWLYRITTTTAFDHGATEARHSLLPALVGPEPEPADALDSFGELIVDLSPRSKQALHLRFVEDLEHAQIARRLGCSESAARQRVSSAVRALRRRMK